MIQIQDLKIEELIDQNLKTIQHRSKHQHSNETDNLNMPCLIKKSADSQNRKLKKHEIWIKF